jgi:hypothetical protein
MAMIRKEPVMAYFKIPYNHLFGQAEERHEKHHSR